MLTPLRMLLGLTLGLTALLFLWSWPSDAQAHTAEGPAYTAKGELIRPTDYREWVYLSSGLGMTYGPAQPAAGEPPRFDNVFVTREAYREFMRSGTWPEKTMFILEVRRAEANVSIDNGGRSQGDVVAIEADVKDTKRFPEGGWGYFNFVGPRSLTDSAAPLPTSASCYACHKANSAVDNTFVQFYPTLFDVAKTRGTVKPTYDPTRKL
jgi:hypothetical protein